MNRLLLALVAALGFALPILVIGCATAKVTPAAVERPVNTVEAAPTAVPTALPAPQPTPAPTATDLVMHRDGLPRYHRHQVVKGDTLWGVSRTYLRTGFLWPMVCEQNGIEDCDRIEVGDRLRVLPRCRLGGLPKADLDRWRQRAYDAHP